MTPAQRMAVTGLSATLIASGMAAADIAESEGFVQVGYVDIAGVKTRCLGNTSGGIVVGKRYTIEECMDLFAADLVEHGRGVQACITVPIPLPTRAAFIMFTYNFGVAAFCDSTMARKANTGDIASACAEFSRWNKAKVNGTLRVVQGLVTRRARERAYCERGLT